MQLDLLYLIVYSDLRYSQNKFLYNIRRRKSIHNPEFANI